MPDDVPSAGEPDEPDPVDEAEEPEAAPEPKLAQRRAEIFDRTFWGSLDDLLRRQSEILRSATQPVVARWAKQQANIFRAHSAPLFKNLGANLLGKQLQGCQQNLIKPYADALTNLRKLQTAHLKALPQFSTIYKLPALELPWLESLRTDVTRLLPDVDFSAIRRGFLRACPPNWQDLADNVSLTALFELTEAGIPTAWVPRAPVLEELVAAEEAERPAVLEARREEVVDDCSAAIKEVSSAELSEYVVLLEEAVAVARLGRLAAAQPLAASVFDTTLRHTFEPERITGYYKKVKNEIRDRHENGSMSELRWGLVHVPVLVVLNLFDPAQGHPVPTNFNRHASAHAAGLIQYTPANAVIALALATSLLREAHQKLVDGATAQGV